MKLYFRCLLFILFISCHDNLLAAAELSASEITSETPIVFNP